MFTDDDADSLRYPSFLSEQIIEKMNGQGQGAETIPFSVAVKAQGNIEDWLCDLLFKMQVCSVYTRFFGNVHMYLEKTRVHQGGRDKQDGESVCPLSSVRL